MHESENEVAQSCPTRSNPMDCSLPGSSVHGIFQARVLEWGAIAFSICIVNKAEIDVFLELSCFFHDPADDGNLISGSLYLLVICISWEDVYLGPLPIFKSGYFLDTELSSSYILAIKPFLNA